MAKNKVSEWSAIASNNTDIGGIDIAEGCAPSGINNAIREMMAQIKDMETGADGDNLTVGGNLTVTGTTTFTGGLATDLAIADGGTGASTASDARTNLGLGSLATQASSSVTITGGSITGITDLSVADGGTGVSTISANAVILGNGTSAIQTVAPGTSGNVLTSNGTTWTSSAPTFTSSATANGYIKIGNITLQWGTTSPIANNSTTTVTFPVAFDNSLLNVQCEAISSDNVIAYWNGVKTSKTTMTLGLDGVSASGTYAIAWFAIGY